MRLGSVFVKKVKVRNRKGKDVCNNHPSPDPGLDNDAVAIVSTALHLSPARYFRREKMPHKDMRDFLRDFFNPPQLMKPKGGKKKIYKKKKKRTGPTPIQLQLKEANEYMKFHTAEFEACESGWERVQLVYRVIPDEATTIDRLWPTQLINKDSRVRRELSARAQECFHYKDFDESLVAYNEATTFSSGKGLAHTLARRAGFLLQTQEHMLALRDLHLGRQLQASHYELS